MSDTSLVLATRLGFSAAYGELATRYRRAVKTVIMGVLPSGDGAEDIVQDALLIGLRSLKQLRDPSKFGSWICAIARNQALRYAQRRQRVQIRPIEEMEERALVEVAENRAGIADTFERTEIIRLVHCALAKLPVEYQTIFRLRYWVGMTVKDIAEFLALPISTAKWKLIRGRKLLINTYRELEHGGEETDES